MKLMLLWLLSIPFKRRKMEFSFRHGHKIYIWMYYTTVTYNGDKLTKLEWKTCYANITFICLADLQCVRCVDERGFIEVANNG